MCNQLWFTLFPRHSDQWHQPWSRYSYRHCLLDRPLHIMASLIQKRVANMPPNVFCIGDILNDESVSTFIYLVFKRIFLNVDSFAQRIDWPFEAYSSSHGQQIIWPSICLDFYLNYFLYFATEVYRKTTRPPPVVDFGRNLPKCQSWEHQCCFQAIEL